MATENLHFNALVAHYQSEKADALATIHLYLEGAVGVGEHPNIKEVLIEATEKLDNAEACLTTLTKHFGSEEDELIVESNAKK